MRRWARMIGWGLASLSAAFGDEILTRDGARHCGTLIQADSATITLQLFQETRIIRRADVKLWNPGPTIEERYAAKLRRAAPDATAEYHLTLAVWCRVQGYTAGEFEQLRWALLVDPKAEGAAARLAELEAPESMASKIKPGEASQSAQDSALPVLAQRAKVIFRQVRMDRVLSALDEKYAIPVVLDSACEALAETLIVNFESEGTWSEILVGVLRPHGWDFVAVGGTVFITTKSRAERLRMP